MNFVLISPNYPDNYWLFCRGLKKYGATVLAIVDTAYENLNPNLIQNIDECYVVNNFNNYDEMIRAVGYFTFKYGKIDWIESNNEAWLSLDARLRDDFNVTTGFDLKTITEYQSKAAMKKYYEDAGIPTARYYLVESEKKALEFAHKIGYPLVLKPDHGVGASSILLDFILIFLRVDPRSRHNILKDLLQADIQSDQDPGCHAVHIPDNR